MINKCTDCKEINSPIYLSNHNTWTQLTMDYYRKDNKWQISAMGDDVVNIDINFCLFCGRQLNIKYKVTR